MKPSDLSASHLVIMLGIPGAGKSFFAENFADTFQSPIISYDKLYKNLDDCEFDQKSKNMIISHILKYMLEEISKTKRTIIFDGRIYSRASCAELIKVARKLKYEPLFVLVHTDALTARKRIIKAAHNNDKSVIPKEKFDKIVTQFNSMSKNIRNVVVISGKHTYQTQLKIVLKYLSESH